MKCSTKTKQGLESTIKIKTLESVPLFTCVVPGRTDRAYKNAYNSTRHNPLNINRGEGKTKKIG